MLAVLDTNSEAVIKYESNVIVFYVETNNQAFCIFIYYVDNSIVQRDYGFVREHGQM